MIKRDALTDEERAEAFDWIKYILEARQDAKTLPIVLRNTVCREIWHGLPVRQA